MARKEKVRKVFDGNSFLTSKWKYPARLYDVDTPEKREPRYQKAKQELTNLILDKNVTIETVARDKYNHL